MRSGRFYRRTNHRVTRVPPCDPQLISAARPPPLHYLMRSVRRRAATLYAGHVQQLGGANPLPNLMEVKG